MKVSILFFLLLILNVSFAVNAEEEKEPRIRDVKFYEKHYSVKIKGVKTIDEYSDPDQYFSAIARQVGIPQLAFKAVEKKYGWKITDDYFMNAMVKGSSVQDDWGIMVTRFDKKAVEKMQEDKLAGKSVSPEKFKEFIEMKMVVIGYDGKISFPEEEKKKSEKPKKK